MSSSLSRTQTSRTVLSGEQKSSLVMLTGGLVSFDDPLCRHTTLKIGGPADAWVAPSNIAMLVEIIRYCIVEQLPILAIGGGSNLLVRDGGVRGVVVGTRELREISQISNTTIHVQAGVSTGKLLSMATKWSLGGAEFLAGVPGSVGGGLVMNAGTFVGEFKDITTNVRSLRLSDGSLIERTNRECGFVYRGSALPNDEIVLEAWFLLKRQSREKITATVKMLRERRKAREPVGGGNAGSVFKNPEGDFAGRLLESIGYKGRREGQAACSSVHANWFVNLGGASASDMMTLIEEAKRAVRSAHGLDLTLEWKCVGED